MTGAPLPNSMRLRSSSQVLRASPQMLAAQLTGPCPRDSTRKLDWKPDGTCKLTGPFSASAVSPVPLQLVSLNATEIGPFSVLIRRLPWLPETLIGPLVACTSASPE